MPDPRSNLTCAGRAGGNLEPKLTYSDDFFPTAAEDEGLLKVEIHAGTSLDTLEEASYFKQIKNCFTAGPCVCVCVCVCLPACCYGVPL